MELLLSITRFWLLFITERCLRRRPFWRVCVHDQLLRRDQRPSIRMCVCVRLVQARRREDVMSK
jgi:hypothetical protein